jgi:D-alanyl-lipoteichoic acid acyltransferase DltB (MBOAT superfamily)
MQSWWTAIGYSEYHRRWNIVIYDFFRTYIYEELTPVSAVRPDRVRGSRGRHAWGGTRAVLMITVRALCSRICHQTAPQVLLWMHGNTFSNDDSEPDDSEIEESACVSD